MKFLFQKENTYAGESSVRKNCEICNEEFKAYARSIKKGQGRYCSIKCSAQSRIGVEFSLSHRQELSKIAKEKGFGKWMKGKKLSKEWAKNIGLASGFRTHSLESRKKISDSHKGEKSYLWQGGKTEKNRKIRNSFEYKLWRESVFKRDNFTCMECSRKGGELNADHIKPFAYYPELRIELSNGRTLCRDCHKKTDTWGYKLPKLSMSL